MSIRNFFKPAAGALLSPGGAAAVTGPRLAKTAKLSPAPSPKRFKSSNVDGTDDKASQEQKGVEDSNSTLTAEEPVQLNTTAAEIKKNLGEGGAVKQAAALLPPDWCLQLSKEFSKDYFRKLDEFVTAERANRTVFPPQDETLTALRLCPLDKVRVVIVGQDPYHGPGQAHGLSFSVKPGVAIPPSLLNMYKELEKDPAIMFKRPGHGCLVKWAEQGVLMLNACLTVRKGEANSHQKQGWEAFTDAIIAELNKKHTGLVFLLWGKPAEKKCGSVDSKRHHILKAPHPSPLSAHRGFFGCCHFSQTNEILEKAGQPTIEWQV
ncbi:uracil-DNA glycosylase-like protein [Baffinella frigidus]|nr:uracil-DNA glycosylase-like protein [Cryptophyta sp. CCMP2293]